ncbi:serine/threonine-protein phosphatase 2A 55 kDa regulatory subunit B delta isoform [Platysternon megacephalum]|uniref:Serine/threonine-protein phosphatase 2A 55 kDa regulatory subunit B delta isoform n=1 Tax=Platysternon megacephalum TaxID=55544 RepID=A0A4D9DQQ5_9SAUR|nr:serine/threonine-protein phosphatase 2A 55 kDa regulatory subunit B delta isoform [Platysternon megacephalum]
MTSAPLIYHTPWFVLDHVKIVLTRVWGRLTKMLYSRSSQTEACGPLVVHRDLSSHTGLAVKVYGKTLKIHYFANVTSPFKQLQQFPQGCCWSSMGQEVLT